MAQDELARAFLTTQSFRWDPEKGFQLASGVVSPFYVDCRLLLANPGPRQLVARLAFDRIKNLDVDCIGGLEVGAIPLAVAISAYGHTATPSRNWRTFVVRKEPKDHGLGKLIEGAARPGDRALIVDDVLTSGSSVIKAVKAAREAGLKVSTALVVVDREEQEGRARVEAEGLALLSLLSIKDLLSVTRPQQEPVT